jgi:hypothetical protein
MSSSGKLRTAPDAMRPRLSCIHFAGVGAGRARARLASSGSARSRIFLALVAVVGALACRSVSTDVPINLDAAVAAHAEPVRAWEVRDGGRAVGSVVWYADQGRAERGFFSVRNLEQQVLGIVDIEGRAWRYRPHERDPEWLGTGTVARGASWILGCSESCEIAEVPLESLHGANAPSAATPPMESVAR